MTVDTVENFVDNYGHWLLGFRCLFTGDNTGILVNDEANFSFQVNT